MDGEQMNHGNEGSAGPIIGVIIILAVIVLGGLYFWGQRTNETANKEDNLAADLEDIQNQSSSDEVTAIEADLQSTDIDGLDAELNASN